MKYDIKKIITELQNFQRKNPNVELIREDELLSLATSTIKINKINKHISTLKELGIEYNNNLLMTKDFSTAYKISNAATKLNVTRATIYKWIKYGVINKIYSRITDKTNPLIRLDELMKNLNLIKKRLNQRYV